MKTGWLFLRAATPVLGWPCLFHLVFRRSKHGIKKVAARVVIQDWRKPQVAIKARLQTDQDEGAFLWRSTGYFHGKLHRLGPPGFSPRSRHSSGRQVVEPVRKPEEAFFPQPYPREGEWSVSARDKLNLAYLGGAIMFAAVLGLMSQSWLVFIIIFAIGIYAGIQAEMLR